MKAVDHRIRRRTESLRHILWQEVADVVTPIPTAGRGVMNAVHQATSVWDALIDVDDDDERWTRRPVDTFDEKRSEGVE